MEKASHKNTLNRKIHERIRNYAKIITFSCAFVFLFALFSVKVANAATLYFSPSSGSFDIGQSFLVGVYVSSADQAMNAASGTISFPKDKLEVVSLSKGGTIFNLWVQEPTFSNEAGVISFEGIVLNPGFIGSTGKIITINFKGKTAGSAPLSFSSGSILANDGKGTNILASMVSGAYTISPTMIPTPPSGTSSAPKISSPTHSDSEKWYSNNDPKFTWEVPKDVTGVKLLVNHKLIAIPTVFYPKPIAEKQLEDLADGTWYFHCQLQNKFGWGEISHFKFQIDTTPPQSFKIEVKEGKETTSPQPTLIFETNDETSGIDYYEIKIDQGDQLKIAEKEYKIPAQTLGKHTIIVKAVDKAGNYTLSMTEINILPIKTPIITDYPQILISGNTLSLKGIAIPEATIKVCFQKDEKGVEIGETKSDKDGKWFYLETEPLEKGIYNIWAEAIDSSGARSEPSEKVTVQITPPVFIRIGKLAIDYLTTFITFLVLILVIIFGIVWSWRKIRQRRKILGKETTEAEFVSYRAFKNLKEKVERETVKLDGEPDLSKREKKILDDLKEYLNASEKLIDKEIKDIKKR